MTALTDRLPDLAGLLDNLADTERRELEDAFLRVLALSQRARPTALPEQVPAAEPEQVAAARARNLARAAQVRADLVRDSLSTAEVAARLGISPAAVTKRRGKDDLVAFRHRGDWRYPQWQFTGDALTDGVLDVWHALPERSLVGRVRWFTLPARQLDDQTPLERLHHGQVDAVIEAATAVGSR